MTPARSISRLSLIARSALFFICIGISTPLSAASFDCQNAKTDIEHMICNDKELSVLDDKMGVAYRDRLAHSDENARAGLKEDQKDWLKWRKIGIIDCTDDNPKPDTHHSGAICLKDYYKIRIETLANGCEQDEVNTIEGIANGPHPWSSKIPKGYDIQQKLEYWEIKPEVYETQSFNLPTKDLPQAYAASAGLKDQYKELSWCLVTGPDGKKWLADQSYDGMTFYIPEADTEPVK